MNKDDLCYESTTSLARRIRAGEVSPRDAVTAYLERIERVDPRVHAYLHVAAEHALAAARRAEQVLADGRALGLLHGVPVAVKDLFDTAGLTTLSQNLMNGIPDVNMDLSSSTNQPFNLSQNQMIGSKTGLLISGNATKSPVVTMNADSFSGTTGYYIQEVAAPNDVWPSTASVTFDGLKSGLMTLAQFNTVLTKIFDKHNDPALGLVLDFIPPVPPTVGSITPPTGPAGTIVTVTGTNFVAGTTVLFGGVAATSIVVNSDTSISVTVPPGSGTVAITVTTPFGTVLVPAAYTYLGAGVVAAPVPVDSCGMLVALALSLAAGGFLRRRHY